MRCIKDKKLLTHTISCTAYSYGHRKNSNQAIHPAAVLKYGKQAILTVPIKSESNSRLMHTAVHS